MEKLYPFIEYKNGKLHVENTDLETIAKEIDTPTYVYSKQAIVHYFNEFDEGFKEVEHLTCFAVKSCSNINILSLLKELGAGADTVSKGEIFRSLVAGIPPKKIVFAGVGKRKEELEYAVEKEILMINVESESEFKLLEKVAEKLGKKVTIAFRVNPEVNPKTHPYIATGIKNSKFGIDFEKALKLYRKAKENKWLKPEGIHFHIGSQITEVDAFTEAAAKVEELIKELQSIGIEIKFFDAGGGLGINYNPEEKIVPSTELAKGIVPVVKRLGCTLILEPGRRIVGNAGLLLTRITYVKKQGNKTFYVVDAGMNDLLRPSLYNAYHHIVPVKEVKSEKIKVDVVGPICETGDVIAKERELPTLKEGDLIAVLNAGAYGFSMASNYNSRPRAAEVLVEGENFKVIRQRETLGELIAREVI